MKFKIRKGFTVHVDRVRVTQQNGRPVRTATTSSHWEDETVELTAEEAADHIHKLEPADKESAAFLNPSKAA